MEIIAQVISAQLPKRLKEGSCYRVHSTFSHGINIEAQDRLLFIGNKEEELLPYGILLPHNTLPILFMLSEEGTFQWKEGALCTQRGRIQTKQAREFSNTLPALSSYKKNPEELGRVLLGEELRTIVTGFGESIWEAAKPKGEKKERLAKAIVTGEDLVQSLAQWIGAGPGLTPSGDDFLTGILAAEQLYHFLHENVKKEINELLLKGYTTDVGANQLRCAMEGMFSASWIWFLQAWSEAEEAGMKNYFHKILNYGHTSGSDMFAGFLFAAALKKQS